MKSIFTLFLSCLLSLGLSAQLVEVTFAVDMTGQDADAVFVAGSFQSWTPGNGALSNSDDNAVWARTYMVAPGDYLYKFGIGNDWGNNEGGDPTGLTDNCSVADADGNINRTLTIEAGSDPIVINFIYDSCADSDVEIGDTGGGTPDPVMVTFAVDVNALDPAPADVFVAGAFQGWAPADGQLSDPDGNGVWSGTFEVTPGNYEYKFGLGTDWGTEEGGDGILDCQTNNNRTITINEGDNPTVVYVYNSCDVSSEPVDADDVVNVVFSVDMNDVTDMFDTVFVAGSFQGWTPADGGLDDADGNGIWRRTYQIARGSSIMYKFGQGIDWGVNEGGEGIAECSTDDNRTASIPADATGTIYLSFKYNTCEEVDVTSTNDVSTLGKVSVAPNPMSNVSRITFENSTNASHNVFVTNMAGQTVRSYRGVRGNQLDVERGNLVAGLYFITFRNSAGEQGSLKLMVK